MPFKDYTEPKWKVTKAGPESKYKEGDHVIFTGSPETVILQCSGKTHYREGRYRDDSNIVERAEEYLVKMSAGSKPLQITFDPAGSVAAGSWTAEDNTPGSGGG